MRLRLELIAVVDCPLFMFSVCLAVLDTMEFLCDLVPIGVHRT